MQLTTENAISWYNELPKEDQHVIYSQFEKATPVINSSTSWATSISFNFPDWLLLAYAPVIAGDLEQDAQDLTEVKHFSLLTLLFVALLAGLFSSCSKTGQRTPTPKQLVVLDEQITANETDWQDHYARIVGDSTHCLHIVRVNTFFGEGDTVQAVILH